MRLKYDRFSDEGQLICYGFSLNMLNKNKAPYCIHIDKVSIRTQKVGITLWKNNVEKKRSVETRKATIDILKLAKGMQEGQFFVTNPSVYRDKIIDNLKQSNTYMN